MDFLRGQYVIYGPARIILIEDEVRGQYNPNSSIYSILTELKVLNFYITYVFQYYYLNIKILKYYENWNFLNIFFLILKSYENLELFWKFWNFEH